MEDKIFAMFDAELEVPEIVEEKANEAFAQIRAQAGQTADVATAEGIPVRPGEQTVESSGARKRSAKRIRSIWSKTGVKVAASLAAAIVVGGALLTGGGFIAMNMNSASTPQSLTAETEEYSGANSAGTLDQAGDYAADVESNSMAAPEEDVEQDIDAKNGYEHKEHVNGFSQRTDKLVYSSQLTIETSDFEQARKVLREKMEAVGAFIEYEEELGSGTYATSDYDYYDDTMTPSVSVGPGQVLLRLRVPSDKYEAFVDSLDEVGTIVSKTSQVENLASSYEETEARIESLETQQKRLNELLEKAESIDEMLEIEDRLADIRAELEYEKSYRDSVDTDVAYSQVTITLRDVNEVVAPSVEAPLPERLVQAAGYGWQCLVGLITGLLVGLVTIWPVLVVLAIAAAVIVLVVRRRRSRTADSEDMPEPPK